MSDEILDLLRRIAKDVADVKAAMAASVGASAAALGVKASSGSGPGAGSVASDQDLDGQYGDPIIKKDPPRWQGEPFAGRHLSEATPEYLDDFASFCEWKASKNEADPAKKKYAAYDRRDAARARGWAARIRSGWKPPGAASEPTDDDYGDGFGGGADDIPF